MRYGCASQGCRWIVACVVGLGVLVTAGCGSSGSGTTGGDAGGPDRRSSRAGSKAKTRPPKRRPRRTSRPPTARRSRRLAERQTGTALKRHATPAPPLSRCRLGGPGTAVNVYLDAGFAANQRYHNRIEETVQFNGQNPDGLPQPVPHVGEKAAYNSAASWIPALRLAARRARQPLAHRDDLGRRPRRPPTARPGRRPRPRRIQAQRGRVDSGSCHARSSSTSTAVSTSSR